MTARIANLGGIETFSGVSANANGRPFVTIRVLDENGRAVVVGNASPEDTRAMALNLLAVAEAAESDAAVYAFLVSSIGLDENTAAATLAGLREHRDGQGSTDG